MGIPNIPGGFRTRVGPRSRPVPAADRSGHLLAAAVRAKVPVLARGEPGVGKSATINQFGVAWDRHVEAVVGSIRDAADIPGLPIDVDGVVRNAPVDWAVRCIEANQALLFLAELTTCPPTVMNALLRVCQERVVGDLVLPESVAIVAAANPPSMAVNGHDPVRPDRQPVSAPHQGRGPPGVVGRHVHRLHRREAADLIGRHSDGGALRARAEVVAFNRYPPGPDPQDAHHHARRRQAVAVEAVLAQRRPGRGRTFPRRRRRRRRRPDRMRR